MHRTKYLTILGLVCLALVPATIYVTVSATLSESGETAAEELSALSTKSVNASYFARYGGSASGIDGEGDFLTVYRQSEVALRFDLAEPIRLDEDETETEPVMRGGDILILGADQSSRGFYSCRRERGTCRSGDGLEALAIAAFGSLFLYPFGAVYEQPHEVERAGQIEAAGESGQCFVIKEKDPDAVKTQPPGLGVVVGEGLPVTLCYASDGVPLFYAEGAGPESPGLKALEISREVDASAFELPFPFEESVYDE